MRGRTPSWIVVGACPLVAAACGLSRDVARHVDGEGAGGTPASRDAGAAFGSGGENGSPCPLRPKTGDPCSAGPAGCPYPAECDGGGECTATCIAGAWFVSCPPCGTPFDCPATAPAHGSSCPTGTTQSCVFDSCDDGGALFLAATCSGGTWSVTSRICAILSCRGGEDDFGCAPGSACVEKPVCSPNSTPECRENPCPTSAFSCACASVYCGDGLVCDSAIDGRITCKEPPRAPTDPFVLADGLSLAGPLAIREGVLYAAVRTPNAVVAIDSATGARQDLGEQNGYSHDVVADADGIYWAEAIRVVQGSPGGATTVLVEGTTAERLAVDANYLYLTVSVNDSMHPAGVERAPKGGGAVEWLAPAVAPSGIAVDATGIYFSDRTNSTNLGIVYRLPPGSDTPAELATEQGYPGAVALDAANVYWLTEWPPAVQRAAKSGGVPTTLWSGESGKTAPKGVALDGSNLYFTDGDSGDVLRVPIAGGPATVVGTGPSGADGLALDDRYVYWATTCGRVLRAEK